MDYLLNFTDDAGHIRDTRRFEAEDDAQAIRSALRFAEAEGAELWQADRLVKKLPPEGAPGQSN